MTSIATVISQILGTHRARATSYIGTSVGTLLLGVLHSLPAAAADPACLLIVVNACVANSLGSTGTPAPAAGFDGPGHAGGNGGPAADLSATFTEQTVYQGFAGTSPLNVESRGGAGAQGSDAYQGSSDNGGGAGGYGGAAGNVSVTTVGSQIGGHSSDYAPSLLVYSLGGAGGAAAAGSTGGDAGLNTGVGGNAGTVTATLDGSWSAGGSLALYAVSQGGAGGRGRDSSAAGLAVTSPYGAQGGDGNTVNVTILGQFQGDGGQIDPVTNARQPGGTFVGSVGGAGGNGGPNGVLDGDQGGDGGAGGAGGNVTVTLAKGASVLNLAQSSAALWVQSSGGEGGVGGLASVAGKGGTGGAAGNVNVTLNGQATSTGYMAPAVLVQSLGGAGNNGGNGGGWFNPNAGEAAMGGAAGTVTITGSGASITAGLNQGNDDISPGILAQSIGGGGGTGGHSDGWFAVGGSGGNAVNGAAVEVSLTSSTVTTTGLQSDGIAAQSIGGGGGKGGDAQGHGAGINMTIGGTGGDGGDGGTVTLSSGVGDIVTTQGQHSVGLMLQSIGGGGGDGGAAYGEVTSSIFALQVSVGGSGGDGGDGGDVIRVDQNGTKLATNAGQILTSGSDSFGILGQSIGGGGGRGGASSAQATAYGAEDYPNLSVAVAIGGSGGNGGDGGAVTLANSGLIATSGQGAIGMLEQSIGGGGGSGGDASATSQATGGEYNLSASVSIAGSGGSGGNGGLVQLGNSGLIITTGESADGMLAQSIGGGGGTGGTGDAKASGGGDGTNISLSVALGGQGGAGGTGGEVSVSNNGSIITLGDGAIGFGAQSIGGGGGRAGGAGASTSGSYSAQVAVGGNGGTGGTAGPVYLNNFSTIVTFGADATGIFAQSIGGSGGIAGKAASSLSSAKSTGDGGNGSQTSVSNAISAISQNFNTNGNSAVNDYLGFNNAVIAINSLLGNSTTATPSTSGRAAAALDDDPADELDNVASSGGDTDDDNQSQSIKLAVAVGGTGGSGGNGGLVTLNNYSDVGTTGKMSDGIIAQSIGGGGGKGGAATTASTNNNSGSSIGVGGNGGVAGDGGVVSVTNTGSVITIGPLASGILAQSIGGGGGIGGISGSSKNSSGAANSGQFANLPINVGGSNGASGDGGQAAVTSSGAIVTESHDSIGIVAQSIGGGGGVVKTLATDLDNNSGSSNTQSATNYLIEAVFGGTDKKGSSGASGQVDVTTQAGGTISTSGDNAYGILAQSIAGGGGLVLGGNPNGTSGSDFFGSAPSNGNVTNGTGSNSSVVVNVGADILTSGQGAIGILAQSIGGGGGLAGNTGLAQSTGQSFFGIGGRSKRDGSGGNVAIDIAPDLIVDTQGDYAPAVFVQSIGGGGGRVTNGTGVFAGTAGGTGTGGSINVNVDGIVRTSGVGSAGIFAQSVGDSSSNSPISVTVGATGTIDVGKSGVAPAANGLSAAIYLDHGGQAANLENLVINNGVVWATGAGTNPVAVYSTGGYTAVINNGWMGGDVLLTNNGGTGCFTNNKPGQFTSGDTVTVGPCGFTNAGTVNVGGAGVIGKTTINGNYVQMAGGTLNIDADFSSGKSDTLAINGAATIAGVVDIVPSTLRKTTLTVLTSTGPLSYQPGLQTSTGMLFDYNVTTVGNSLQVTPEAHFVQQAASAGHVEQAVAANLQSVFDSGTAMDTGFKALSTVQGNANYASSLHAMSGEGLGAFGAFRVSSSRNFVQNLYGGCTELNSESDAKDSCTWTRAYGNSASQDAGSDTVGYHADAYTVEIGGQVGLTDQLALVAALGSEHSNFTGDDNTASITGGAAVGGVGLNYVTGPWRLSGAVDGAYGWYNSTRTVAVGKQVGVADANPQQWQIGIHGTVGYEFDLARGLYLKPFVGAQGIRVTNESFTEQGTSPFLLSVDGRSQTTWLADAGLELGAHLRISSTADLHPYIRAGVESDQNSQWTTAARFADASGAPSFDVRTGGPGTLGRFAVGADVTHGEHLSFSLLYNQEVGDGYTYEGGMARVSYRF
jgi:hypothetical protein